MPVVLALLVVAVVMLLAVAGTPLILVQRYRVAASRKKARGWLATLNVVAFGLSGLILLLVAVITGLWEPKAPLFVLGGLATGGLLGGVGLVFSRWEEEGRGLYVTPPRWLVLLVTIVVAARLIYGLWRAWAAIGATKGTTDWITEAGVAGSLSAGAVVIGYSLAYWAGVRRRVGRSRRS